LKAEKCQQRRSQRSAYPTSQRSTHALGGSRGDPGGAHSPQPSGQHMPLVAAEETPAERIAHNPVVNTCPWRQHITPARSMERATDSREAPDTRHTGRGEGGGSLRVRGGRARASRRALLHGRAAMQPPADAGAGECVRRRRGVGFPGKSTHMTRVHISRIAGSPFGSKSRRESRRERAGERELGENKRGGVTMPVS